MEYLLGPTISISSTSSSVIIFSFLYTSSLPRIIQTDFRAFFARFEKCEIFFHFLIFFFGFWKKILLSICFTVGAHKTAPQHLQKWFTLF